MTDCNASRALQHVNVFSGQHLVGTWNPAAGKVYYAYSDWLGTQRYEADGSGTNVNSWTSLPFGDNETALGTGTDATEHHFTGKEHDAESGLDYFKARYYQSQTGRWLLPDWSETPVPVPYATFTNPQSLNLYTYVGNNPVNAVDADGHVEPGSNVSSASENPDLQAHSQLCAAGSSTDCVPDAANEGYTNDIGGPSGGAGGGPPASTNPSQDAAQPPKDNTLLAQNNTPVVPGQNGQPQTTGPKQLSGNATEYNLPGSTLAYGGKFDGGKMAAAMTPDRAKNGQTVMVSYTYVDSKGKVITTTIRVVVNDTGPFALDSKGKTLHPLQPNPTNIIDLTPTAMQALTGRAHNRVPVTVTVPNE